MACKTQVLIISHAFPPGDEVGGKRIARLCRYLPGFSIQPIVFTAEERYYTSKDYSFLVPAGTRVERTAMMRTPLDFYKILKMRLFPAATPISDSSPGNGTEETPELASGEMSRGFRYQLRTLLETPDIYWGWYLPAIRAAEKLIERESIAAIFSSAPPWTSHLIARHLKKKYGIPWVIDFRDSWARDPWRPMFLPRWRDPIDRRLEVSCIRSADLITCVTDFIRRDFVQHYPGLSPAKFVTLTNGYDDAESSTSLLASQERVAEPLSETQIGDLCFKTQHPSMRLLVHLGDLYAGRRIDTFCEAVASLIHCGKLDPDSIQVVFLGNANSAIMASARQRAPDLILQNRIVFHPRVGWEQAQQLLQKADLLLIFQGDHPGVTAKFYEYLRTGKPVLAIVRKGPLSDIVDSTHSGLWADPDDPADIAKKLLGALALPVRSPEVVSFLASQYHYRSLAQRLAGWIYDLTAVPQASVSRR